MKKPLVIFLVGPTASGKSEAAVKLAELINAEIISADSMQVYLGMDIISAKPSQKELKIIPHHLIDIISPSQEYSAAIFRGRALKIIEQVIKRKKVPLITGGTGLYVQALTQGLFEDKGKDEALRKKLFAQAEEKGSAYLYERLKELDPQAAEKIHPNNTRRVIRALEAYEVNKTMLSQLKAKREGLDRFYQVNMFGIERDREKLYRRIEARVDSMFEQGLVKEVEELSREKLSQTAEQALGIKQIMPYLKGTCSLEEAKEMLKRDTRRFAKRQLTWFRKEKGIVWIKADDNTSSEELARRIYSLNFLH